MTGLVSVMADGWVRGVRYVRRNSRPPGEREEIVGPWHVVLRQDPTQTWCGKQMGDARRSDNQRVEEPPGEGSRCPECVAMTDRGGPFPRPNPAKISRRKQ